MSVGWCAMAANGPGRQSTTKRMQAQCDDDDGRARAILGAKANGLAQDGRR